MIVSICKIRTHGQGGLVPSGGPADGDAEETNQEELCRS
jgi:hypothetical protein